MPTLAALVCLAVLGLLATLLTATPASAAADPAGYLAQAAKATNARRAAHDLRPLATDACLQRAAQAQAERMARDGGLSHTDMGTVVSRCGMRAAGENVAQSLGSDQGGGAVRAWMRSAGHRANILKPGYRLLGMGAVRSGGYWWVVQVFGTRA